MSPDTIQLGGAVAIAMSLIELVKWVINRFAPKGERRDLQKDSFDRMTAQLELMNTNHLNHIESAINTGNDKIVSAIQALHIDLIKELNK